MVFLAGENLKDFGNFHPNNLGEMTIQFDLRRCFRGIQITNYSSFFSRLGKETAVDGGVLGTFEHAKTVFFVLIYYISKLTCLRDAGWFFLNEDGKTCFFFESVLKGTR